jgi:TRAP-type mannitol/chloroaromatic compound transport system permease large subunit
MLFIGALHLLIPPYGAEILMVLGSVYPGIASATEAGKIYPSGVLLGGVYGLVDGAIGGFLVAWVYNFFLGRPQQS